MAKILVARFSALGDIAMTIPVVVSMARQYPEHDITVLSRTFVAPIFEGLAPNLHFRGVDLKDRKYHGIAGMRRLYNELKADAYDMFADLHDVLRTKLLRLFFRMDGVRVAHINKEHGKRRRLVRHKNKRMEQLSTSFQKYALVFEKLGIRINLGFKSIFENSKPTYQAIEPLVVGQRGKRWVGVAPFTTHAGKEYPVGQMRRVVEMLAANPNIHVFLFGAGKREKPVLEQWEEEITGVTSVSGKLNMHDELLLMNRLDVMVSMDSANMHLASLVGTPVVSVWGATHPYCGFMGWNQSADNAVQLDMPCRPCSIFGQKACRTNDYACLNNIQPEMIADKVIKVLNF